MFKQFYPYEYVDSVFCIDYQKLFDLGYRAIIFDIDNTLVHHGDDSTIEIDELFQMIHHIGFKTLLLSNNSKERIERFNQNIHAQFIELANKPETQAYYLAIQQLGVNKDEIVMVGDQVFTDILGANRVGLSNILVKFIRLDGVIKLGIRRRVEIVILFFYSMRKAYQNRIGDIVIKEKC